MADAKAMAERLMAWLRGHPACAWPVASTVVMGLHGVTDAERDKSMGRNGPTCPRVVCRS
jgi:hypothetical protein